MTQETSVCRGICAICLTPCAVRDWLVFLQHNHKRVVRAQQEGEGVSVRLVVTRSGQVKTDMKVLPDTID